MIILNHIETAAIEHQFKYWGESLNYARTNTFTLRGRMISDQVDSPYGVCCPSESPAAWDDGDSWDDGGDWSETTSAACSLTQLYGVAYVEDTDIWYPLGADVVSGISGAFPSGTGHLTFEPSGATTTVYGLTPAEIFSGVDYHPYYDIWTEMDNIRDSMGQFQEIFVDGVSIGSGRVTNIGFPQSRDTRESRYEIRLETYSSGDFNSLVSNTFDNVTFDADAIARSLSIDETLTSRTDEDSNSYFDRSLSIGLINDERPTSGFIEVAKSLASGIISGDPSLNNFYAAYPSYYQNQGRRIATETYNSYNGNFSFTERYSASAAQDNYVLDNRISINVGSEGILSYADQGSITLNRLPFSSYADSAYNTVKSNALSDASGILNQYFTGCNNPLFVEASTRNTDLARGVISYSLNLSNDPFSSGGFRVSQAQTIDFSNGVAFVTEQGAITTNEGDGGSGRLQNCIDYFNNNVEPFIYDRAYDYYTGYPYTGVGCQCDESGVQPSSNFVLKESSETYSEYVGQFGYSRGFGIECSSVNDNNFVVTRERSVNDTVHKVFLGRGVNDGEIAQKQNQSSLVNEAQTIVVQGKDSGYALQSYIDAAQSGMLLPSGQFYAEGLRYSFNPVSLALNLNINFNYTGFRAYDNIDV